LVSLGTLLKSSRRLGGAAFRFEVSFWGTGKVLWLGSQRDRLNS
jgi:hypothetical protein